MLQSDINKIYFIPKRSYVQIKNFKHMDSAIFAFKLNS